jgi:hypothetical protein
MFYRLFDGGVAITSSASAFLFIPRPNATLGRSPGAGVPSCEGVLSTIVDIRENPGFGAGDKDAEGPGLFSFPFDIKCS